MRGRYSSLSAARRKFAPTDSNVATKIPMEVVDTPQAISVLSSELMNIVGVNSLQTAAALAPGVINREGEAPVHIDTVARSFETGPAYRIRSTRSS